MRDRRFYQRRSALAKHEIGGGGHRSRKRRQRRTALLSFLCACRPRGRVCNSIAVRRSELGHATGEIVQVQPQLVERKAEGEDALGSLVRQRSGEGQWQGVHRSAITQSAGTWY